MSDRRPKKRSLTLRGHRTSVSLEDEFWIEFRRIAEAKQKPINVLAAEIDADRGLEIGLASAIRLYVLAALQEDRRANAG
ncbi:MAG: ribbon-helix-helix domain-containing protein [Pseudomonadota bacterium]